LAFGALPQSSWSVAAEGAKALSAEKMYFSLRELSRHAGLSVRRLRGYLTDRTEPLPHYRVGGKILVHRTEFAEWVHQFRRTAKVCELNALVDDLMGDISA